MVGVASLLRRSRRRLTVPSGAAMAAPSETSWLSSCPPLASRNLTLKNKPLIETLVRNIMVSCTGRRNVHDSPLHRRVAVPVTCSEPSVLTVAVNPLPDAGP